MGDGDGTQLSNVRPAAGNVVVARDGEAVILKIGNADPIRLRYTTAIAEGQHLMRSARLLPTASLQVGGMRRKLWFAAADAFRIGHWLLLKGVEAKFLASDTKRLALDRRPILRTD